MLPIYLVRAWKRLSEKIHTLLRRYRPRHDHGDSNPKQCLEKKTSILHLIFDAIDCLLLFLLAQLDRLSDEIMWRIFLREMMKEIWESRKDDDDHKFGDRMNSGRSLESDASKTEQA